MNNDSQTSDINEERTKKVSVFRYKFTDVVSQKITEFAKVHQFDNRHDYKDAWQEWMDENSELVAVETQRLQDLGYDKDVNDKMFKAGRYYFRKKTSVAKKPIKRRDYIAIDQSILLAMDEHINQNMNLDEYSPAKGYDMFCGENEELLSREIVSLMKTNTIDPAELSNKIKKTYKNRYYMITRA